MSLGPQRRSERHNGTTFRIGVIGSGMPGKSTLVNALSGREFLPTEAAERIFVSVKIVHDESYGNKVHVRVDAPVYDASETNKACKLSLWESFDGELDDDRSVLRLLNDVSNKYLAARSLYGKDEATRMITLLAPRVEIRARTLLGVQKDLLQLPSGTTLECLDLPGLNQCGADNLPYIQKTLEKTVVIFVLSYDQIAVKKNAMCRDACVDPLVDLIDEVKRTINIFGCGSMNLQNLVFVLNKADRWNEEHSRLIPEVVEDLQKRLKETLDVSENPIVLPMCSLLIQKMYSALGIDEPECETEASQDDLVWAMKCAQGPFDLRLSENWGDKLQIACCMLLTAIEELHWRFDDPDESNSQQRESWLRKRVSWLRMRLKRILVDDDQDGARKRLILRNARQVSGFDALVAALRSRIEYYSDQTYSTNESKTGNLTTRFKSCKFEKGTAMNLNQSVTSYQINYAVSLLQKMIDILGAPIPSRLKINGEENSETVKTVNELKQTLAEGLQRLNRPTLHIGFFGTTSSGKSTLANAFLGREFLPTEAEERSAGIVKIIHDESLGNKIHVKVEAPAYDDASCDDASEESKARRFGLWTSFDGDLEDDQSVLRLLNDVLDKYHATRRPEINESARMTTLLAPQVEIRARILTGVQKDLLKLPSGIALECIDLPGLNQCGDANLPYIQNALGKAVMVVVLDYEQTVVRQNAIGGEAGVDPLADLIDEVKRTINSYGSGVMNTQNLVFVLNKCDRWNRGSKPIPDVVKEVQERLKSALDLSGAPVVLPMSSLLIQKMYSALGIDEPVCETEASQDELSSAMKYAKGRYSLNLPEDDWGDLLSSACDKCVAALEGLAESNIEPEERENLTRQLKKQRPKISKMLIEDDPDGTRKRFILNQARNKSGFDDLLRLLRGRIDEAFPKMVIEPALHDLIVVMPQKIKALNGYCETALNKTKGDLENFIKCLEEIHKKLKEGFERVQKELNVDTQEFCRFMREKSTKNFSVGGLFSRIYSSLEDLFRKSAYYRNARKLSVEIERIESNVSDKLFKAIGEFLQSYGDTQSRNAFIEVLDRLGIDSLMIKMFTDKITPLAWNHDWGWGSITVDADDFSSIEALTNRRDQINACGEFIPRLLSSYYTFQLQSCVGLFGKTMNDVSLRVREQLERIFANAVGKDKNIVNSLLPTVEFVQQKVDVSFSSDVILAPQTVDSPRTKTSTWTTKEETFVDKTIRKPVHMIGSLICDALFGFELDEFEGSKEIIHTETKKIFPLPTREKLVEDWDSLHVLARQTLFEIVETWFRDQGNAFLMSFGDEVEISVERYRKQVDELIATERSATEQEIREVQNFVDQLRLISDEASDESSKQSGAFNDLKYRLIERGEYAKSGSDSFDLW